MPMIQEKVKPGFRPTPAIIKMNPTVRQFSTGQVVNVPAQVNPRTGQPLVRPAPVAPQPLGTGDIRAPRAGAVNGLGVAGINQVGFQQGQINQASAGRYTAAANSFSLNQNLGIAGAGAFNLLGSQAGQQLRINQASTNRLTGLANAYGYVGGVSNYTTPPPDGGGGGYYGGRRRGRGGGGGGWTDYSYDVGAPIEGIGNDINTALNWRIG